MGQIDYSCTASIAGAILHFLMALRAAAGALKQSVGKVAGEQRLVTSAERYSTIDSDPIVARVAQTAGIKEATVRSAILGIKEAIRYFVMNGHSVNLGDFGNLRLSAQGKAVAQKSQVSSYLLSGIALKQEDLGRPRFS